MQDYLVYSRHTIDEVFVDGLQLGPQRRQREVLSCHLLNLHMQMQ